MDETCVGEEVEALETECEDLRAVVSRELQLPESLAGNPRSYWPAEGPAAKVTHSIANGLKTLPRT